MSPLTLESLELHPIDGVDPLFVIHGDPILDADPYEIRELTAEEENPEGMFAVGVLSHGYAGPGPGQGVLVGEGNDVRVSYVEGPSKPERLIEEAIFMRTDDGPAPVELVTLPLAESVPIKLEIALIRGGLLRVQDEIPEASDGIWTEMPDREEVVRRLGSLGFETQTFDDKKVLVRAA